MVCAVRATEYGEEVCVLVNEVRWFAKDVWGCVGRLLADLADPGWVAMIICT